jgi:hypothetical protein
MQKYTLDFNLTNFKCFVLNKYTQLFGYLSKDWTSSRSIIQKEGNPLHLFIPAQYLFKFDADQVEFLLNVNEKNIVNVLNDMYENGLYFSVCLLIYFIVHYSLCAPKANFTLSVLFDKYNSPYSEIPFEFQSSGVTLKLYYAIYNSIYPHISDYDKKHGSQVATIDTLTIIGSYTYFPNVSSGNTDSVKLHIICNDSALILYGHFIYYFLSLKQNYFGRYSKVSTLEDFTEPTKIVEVM